jgi:hypothetical protein
VDGVSLYQYAISSPVGWYDRDGLLVDRVEVNYRHGPAMVYFHVYGAHHEFLHTFPARADKEMDITAAEGAARQLDSTGKMDQVKEAAHDAAAVADMAVRVASGPVDLVESAAEFYEDPSLRNAAGLLPLVPGAVKKLDDVVDLSKVGRTVDEVGDTTKLGKKVDDFSEEAAARSGKGFTKKGKAEVIEANKAAHGGQTVCEGCGQTTVPPTQHQKGVTPPCNETHVDHRVPKSQGGPGHPENGGVLCRECNLEKGDK